MIYHIKIFSVISRAVVKRFEIFFPVFEKIGLKVLVLINGVSFDSFWSCNFFFKNFLIYVHSLFYIITV